jgi:hypothetical protein
VDDFTDYCWSYFVKSKDQFKTKIVELIEELKDNEFGDPIVDDDSDTTTTFSFLKKII